MMQQLKPQENVIQGCIEYYMYMEAHVDMSMRAYRKLLGVKQEADRIAVFMQSLLPLYYSLLHFTRFFNLSMELCMFIFIKVTKFYKTA